MIGDDTEDCRWNCQRSERYRSALVSLLSSKKFDVLRMVKQAERLILLFKGNPPDVLSVENEGISKGEILSEVKALDADYDEEFFAHYAARAKCLFHDNILICFTVNEPGETITFTALEVLETPESTDMASLYERAPSATHIDAIHHSFQRHLMELDAIRSPLNVFPSWSTANEDFSLLRTLSRDYTIEPIVDSTDVSLWADGIIASIVKCNMVGSSENSVKWTGTFKFSKGGRIYHIVIS